MIGICKGCFLFIKLTKHHKDGNHNNDSKDNIEYLCRDCHDEEHDMKPKKKYNKKVQPGTRHGKRKKQ